MRLQWTGAQARLGPELLTRLTFLETLAARMYLDTVRRRKYVRPSLQNMQQGSRILSPSYCTYTANAISLRTSNDFTPKFVKSAPPTKFL